MKKSHKSPCKLLLCLAVGAIIASIAAALIKFKPATDDEVKAD